MHTSVLGDYASSTRFRVVDLTSDEYNCFKSSYIAVVNYSVNKRSKNFDKRRHCQLVTIHGGKCIHPAFTHMVYWAHRSHLGPPNGISISFAIFGCTLVKTPGAFHWGRQSPKLPLPLGDLDPI